MPTSRKASGRRVKRNVVLPEKYSREFPVSDGHDYRLRSVPKDVWDGVRKRAAAEQVSVRFVIIRAMQLYALGRIDLQ